MKKISGTEIILFFGKVQVKIMRRVKRTLSIVLTLSMALSLMMPVAHAGAKGRGDSQEAEKERGGRSGCRP